MILVHCMLQSMKIETATEECANVFPFYRRFIHNFVTGTYQIINSISL